MLRDYESKADALVRAIELRPKHHGYARTVSAGSDSKPGSSASLLVYSLAAFAPDLTITRATTPLPEPVCNQQTSPGLTLVTHQLLQTRRRGTCCCRRNVGVHHILSFIQILGEGVQPILPRSNGLAPSDLWNRAVKGGHGLWGGWVHACRYARQLDGGTNGKTAAGRGRLAFVHVAGNARRSHAWQTQHGMKARTRHCQLPHKLQVLQKNRTSAHSGGTNPPF